MEVDRNQAGGLHKDDWLYCVIAQHVGSTDVTEV